jgi:hypothetical protein
MRRSLPPYLDAVHDRGHVDAFVAAVPHKRTDLCAWHCLLYTHTHMHAYPGRIMLARHTVIDAALVGAPAPQLLRDNVLKHAVHKPDNLQAPAAQ